MKRKRKVKDNKEKSLKRKKGKEVRVISKKGEKAKMKREEK